MKQNAKYYNEYPTISLMSHVFTANEKNKNNTFLGFKNGIDTRAVMFSMHRCRGVSVDGSRMLMRVQ